MERGGGRGEKGEVAQKGGKGDEGKKVRPGFLMASSDC